ALPDEPAEPGALDRLPDLLEAALRVWSDPAERRRMRAFGFVPALQSGVLKRDWHGSQVRVAQGRLVVRAPGWGGLDVRAARGGAGAPPRGRAGGPRPEHAGAGRGRRRSDPVLRALGGGPRGARGAPPPRPLVRARPAADQRPRRDPAPPADAPHRLALERAA